MRGRYTPPSLTRFQARRRCSTSIKRSTQLSRNLSTEKRKANVVRDMSLLNDLAALDRELLTVKRQEEVIASVEGVLGASTRTPSTRGSHAPQPSYGGAAVTAWVKTRAGRTPIRPRRRPFSPAVSRWR